jgi:hypothetical protein
LPENSVTFLRNREFILTYPTKIRTDFISTTSRKIKVLPPEGFEGGIRNIRLRSLPDNVLFFLTRLSQISPLKKRLSPNEQRDSLIRALHEQGMTPKEIAARFSISFQRVYQIIGPSNQTGQ